MSFQPVESLHNYDTVTFRLPPDAEPHRLEIDMARIGRAATIMGFRPDVDVWAAAEAMAVHEVSANPEVAARQRRRDRETTAWSSWPYERPDAFAHSRPPLRLTFNTFELGRRMANRKPAERVGAEYWAPEMDAAARAALLRAGNNHMIGEAKPGEIIVPMVLSAMFGGSTMPDALASAAELHPFSTGALTLGGFVLAHNTVRGVYGMVRGKRLRDVCWSALPVWHSDRIGLAWLYLMRRQLVRVAPSGSQDGMV